MHKKSGTAMNKQVSLNYQQNTHNKLNLALAMRQSETVGKMATVEVQAIRLFFMKETNRL